MIAPSPKLDATTTSEIRRETDAAGRLRMRERSAATHENAILLQRVSELRGALRAAAEDNAQLQRKLARVRAENRRLRHEAVRHHDHSVDGEYVRRALTEPWSRNP